MFKTCKTFRFDTINEHIFEDQRYTAFICEKKPHPVPTGTARDHLFNLKGGAMFVCGLGAWGYDIFEKSKINVIRPLYFHCVPKI